VDYYNTFSRAYMKGIDAAKERGEIRSEINSEVLAWVLMGASNFLGLNWGLFSDYSTDNDLKQVVDSFMNILTGGVFTEIAPAEEKESNFPIRIEVEFDDDEESDGEEDEILLELPGKQEED
jgi:hypothetical protein